jgi:(4S)-4-hydroxy-5-phosphonooxypentane-2,3-dione isomerase
MRRYPIKSELLDLSEWARCRARQGPVLLDSTTRPEQVADVQTRLGGGASAGLEDRFLKRVSQQAADSLHAEADCRRFDVSVDLNDPRHIFLYEIYVDRDAFAAHLRSSHFIAFDRETTGWVDEKVVERWRTVAID